MSNYSIRPIELTDASAAAELITQLGYPTSPQEMETRLKTLLSLSEYITFVAESDSQIIGLGGVYLAHALEYNNLYGRITALVVDKKWRGAGVGRSLLNEIELWSKERGAIFVTLTTGKQRLETHKFYRHVGYSDTGLRFVKNL